MKQKNNKAKKIILIIVVIILIIVAAIAVLSQMKKSQSVALNSNTNTIHSFYAEEKNSLNGVYIGSSAANRDWVPARAFEKEGICIYNMGTTTQPFIATKYLIKEALKTQPDMDVIIVDLRASVRNTNNTASERIKQLTDGVPFSKNRNDMIARTLDFFKEAGADIDFNGEDYYLPMLRDKGAWLKDYRIGMLRVLYFDRYHSINKGFVQNFETVDLNEPIEYTESEPIMSCQEEMIDDLLAYCKTIEPEVIFVSAPYESNYGWEKKLKYVVNKCEKAGFDTLDFNCNPLQSQINIDWDKDFADFKHMNTFGAVKYADFLTDYITKTYELEDHRNEPGYESWHEAVKHLNEEINKHQD